MIVGLDTSTTAWHAVGEDDLRASGRPEPDANPDVRRLTLWTTARMFFQALPDGSHIFCEEPLALQNGKTTRLLGLAAGAIWAAHLECDIYWYWVNNVDWKKAVIGKGNADKGHIQEVLQAEFGVDFPEQDFYDAFAIREYGVDRLAKAGVEV